MLRQTRELILPIKVLAVEMDKLVLHPARARVTNKTQLNMAARLQMTLLASQRLMSGAGATVTAALYPSSAHLSAPWLTKAMVTFVTVH